MTDNKPCPFCGSKEVAFTRLDYPAVMCLACGARGEVNHDKYCAEILWNRRPTEKAIEDKVTKLKDYLGRIQITMNYSTSAIAYDKDFQSVMAIIREARDDEELK